MPTNYEIGQRIKARRQELDLTLDDVARQIGLAKSTIQRYENGKIEKLKLPVIEAISNVLGVSPSWVCCKTDDPTPQNISVFSEPLGEIVTFPILASVAAGYNGLAREEYSDEVEALPHSFLRGYDPAELRVLRVSGNSMYPRFLDGDRVLVHLQSAVDDGETAVVIYNGDEATVKRVYCKPGVVELVPFNPEYQTRRIEGVDLEQFRIFGKVIKLIRDV